MANLFQPSLIRGLDTNANPTPFGQLRFDQTGTTTPATIFVDQAGTTPHANPVVADASGRFPPVYLDADTTYRVRWFDKDGALIPGYDIDPVRGYDEGMVQTAAQGAIAAKDIAVASAAIAVDAKDKAVAASQYRVSIGYKTYAQLAAVVGSSGQTAVVFDDAGTHTDPVVGGTVANQGVYRYSTAPAGWERIANLEAADAKQYRDQAEAAAATATAAAASINAPLFSARTTTQAALSTDGYDLLYKVPRGGATSGINAFRYAQLIPCGSSQDHVPPNVVIDQIGVITQLPAGWTKFRVRVYERALTNPSLNSPPPVAGDSLIYDATHTSTAEFIDLYVSGTGTTVYGFKVAVAIPWVARTGYGYVVERWFEDAGGTRLQAFLGNNIAMPAGDPQYLSGWYSTTAGGAYVNFALGRAVCVSLLTRHMTGPSSIPDSRYSAPPARDLARLNSSALPVASMLYPISAPISMAGNSIVQQIANNTAPVLNRRTSDVLAKLFPNCPVLNVGAGGATDAQIIAQINALTPAQKAGVICVSVGRGSYSQTADNSAAIIADYDAIEALGLPYVLYCIDYSPTAYGSEEKELEIKIRELLKAKSYWPRVIDFPMIWQRYAARTVPDIDQLRRGAVIQSLMTDGETPGSAVHLGPSAAVGWAYEWARMSIAVQGGAPYIRDQRFTYKASDPPGTAVGTIAVLGDWQAGGTIRIVAGNDDTLFAINEDTGVLSKGTKIKDLSFNPDFRELWVSVENGFGEHVARIVVGREHEGTVPPSVRLRGDNSQLLGRPDGGLFANSATFTLALYFRNKYGEDTPSAPRQLFGGLSGASFQNRTMGRFTQTGATVDMFLTSVTGAANAMGNVMAPCPRNSAAGALFLFSVDAAAGIFRARTNFQPVVNGTVSNDTIKLADLQGLLCGQPLDGFSLAGDISFVWADTAYHDPADDAVVGKFIDSNCRPISLGANGETPFGAAPRLCMYGSPDDWMRGLNRGTGGNFFPRFWTDRDLIGFSTPGVGA